jgi:signal transduction histidine kinase
MELALTDLLSALDRSADLIDGALAGGPAANSLAAGLAGALRALYPAAPLSACVVWEAGQPRASVLEDGPTQDRAPALCQALAAGTAPARALGLPEDRLAVEEAVVEGQRRAVLVLALPPGAGAYTGAAVRTLLRACGRHLALRLQLREARGEAALTWLADIGELAGPVVHEVNNILNALFLHVALLESATPETLPADAGVLPQLRTRVTTVLRQFQQYRQGEPPVLHAVDLKAVLREAVGGLRREAAEEAGALRVVSLHDLPLVLGTAPDLRRLFTFLLKNALAASPGHGDVTVHTEAQAGKVSCRVEDPGPPVPPEALAHFFDPSTLTREGANGLELAACGTLVRRLQGTIQCENTAEGGFAVTVTLPAGT